MQRTDIISEKYAKGSRELYNSVVSLLHDEMKSDYVKLFLWQSSKDYKCYKILYCLPKFSNDAGGYSYNVVRTRRIPAVLNKGDRVAEGTRFRLTQSKTYEFEKIDWEVLGREVLFLIEKDIEALSKLLVDLAEIDDFRGRVDKMRSHVVRRRGTHYQYAEPQFSDMNFANSTVRSFVPTREAESEDPKEVVAFWERDKARKELLRIELKRLNAAYQTKEEELERILTTAKPIVEDRVKLRKEINEISNRIDGQPQFEKAPVFPL